ncbi:MAG TPA: lipopolysaccharide biosynthesis protein [Cyanothece sp. UBA12306]|nr:lipopolysaccharide biosynthesis protein [Cyanothece sp. UBA12306]
MNLPPSNLPEEEIEEFESASESPQKGFNPRPYLRTFLRKSWLIAGITALTSFAGWIIAADDPYTYTGNFYLLVEPISSSAKLTNPTTLTRTGGVPNEGLFELDYPTNLVFLTSPGMTLQIAQDVHNKERNRQVPAIWKDLRDNLKVTRASIGQGRRGTATKIFEVSYTGKKPGEVQTILSTAADTFVRYSAEDRETNIKAGVKFIDQQLPDLQERLEKLKVRQKQMRQKYELIDPVPKNNEILNQISATKQQIFELETQLKTSKEILNNLQDQLKLNPKEAWVALTLAQDPARIQLMNQVQSIEQEIATTSITYTKNSPQVEYLEEQKRSVSDLLNQKTQEILAQKSLSISLNSPALQFQDATRITMLQQLVDTNNQIEIIENQLKPLVKLQQDLQKQANNFPKLINEYGDLERQIALTEELLNKFLLQRETLKVEASQELPWQLISKPQIPLDGEGKPIGSPPDRKKKILAGVFGGLFFGMGASILWEKRRNVFFVSEDIPDILSIPLIVNIPKDDRSQILESIALESELPEKSPESEAITVNSEPEPEKPRLDPDNKALNYEMFQDSYPSDFILAFDELYAQFYLLHSANVRSVLISSVEAKDGQSTVAMNFAISAATIGKKVLLVDVNWNQPQLHEWLDVPNDQGLCQVINYDVCPNDIIQSVPNVENLFILTAGNSSPNPPKRLWSTRMQDLLEELPKSYDLVVYDVPHFFDNPDIKFIGLNVDGILMVVTVQKTPQSLAKKAVKSMKELNLPLIGLVANNLI